MKKVMKMMVAMTAALALVMTMSVSVFAAGISNRDAALAKALKNAGLKKSQVKYVEVEFDNEDNIYEVEFTKKTTGTEYSYEIGASSGKIFEKSVDRRYKRNSSHKKIGKTAAMKKVAKYSGISYKTIKTGSCHYEYDDGKGTYEVRFVKGNHRYNYEVLAPTGKIIEYEWELINRY